MNTRQSIETRYVGPTNNRGSRIAATSASGHRHTHHWDYSLNIEANHYAAAKALQAKLEWEPIVAGGSTKVGFVWLVSTLDDTAHKLQTAAPDLLDIVSAFADWYDDSDGDTTDLAFLVAAARAAIAKAKGE